MGRQHTTWISDETWKKLENIEGDSVSEKIRNAINKVDPDREMMINSEMRRLSRLVGAMKRINSLLTDENIAYDPSAVLITIETAVDEVEFCWRD